MPKQTDDQDTGDITRKRAQVSREDNREPQSQPSEEDLYRQQRGRTRRRQTTSFFVIVAVVIAIGVLAAAINQGVVNLPFGASKTPCPAQPPPAAAPEQTPVRVLNASDRTGVAKETADGLRARGYQILVVGNAEGNRDFPDPAQIRHGKNGVPTARAVQAQVPGSVLVEDARPGADVDLVLGANFQSLATDAQAKEALRPAPSPTDCVPAS